MSDVRDGIRIGVRSGAAADARTNGTKPVKVVFVHGGSRPMIWLGGEHGKHDGLAWISGRDTLRRLRDALTEALEQSGDAVKP